MRLCSTFLLGLLSSVQSWADGPFKLENWLNLMESRQTTTLEQAIALLPEEHRRNYVLSYRSFSLQGASEKMPRAILFGSDAKFIAAFNGDPDQALGNSIEIMQFDDRTSRFELFALEFPLVRNRNGRVPRPQKNPALCLNCHRQDPKPIFNLAFDWPGFYGSRGDRITGGEIQALEEFLRNASSSPRYRQLQRRARKTTSNLRFTRLVSELHEKRNFRMIRSAPFYARYRELLLHSLSGCEQVQALRKSMGEVPYRNLERRLEQDWSPDVGYTAFVLENWGRPIDLLPGIFLVPDADLSLQFPVVSCIQRVHGSDENSGCAGRKLDGRISMQEKLAKRIAADLDWTAPTEKARLCSILQSRLRTEWSAPSK